MSAGSHTKEFLIAGVDEAGRGPLAGPVVAAAVILNPKVRIQGLKDSKQLTALQREALYTEIEHSALAWAVAEASVSEIDELNILQATLLAMRRAVMALQLEPDQVHIDGPICPKLPYQMLPFVKGDQYKVEISAASILAKVSRDRKMIAYDAEYPQYGFAAHKGYGTREHLKLLQKFGATPIHRQSFAPVRDLLVKK